LSNKYDNTSSAAPAAIDISPAFQSRDNASIRLQSRQRRLNLLIGFNRRCRDWND